MLDIERQLQRFCAWLRCFKASIYRREGWIVTQQESLPWVDMQLTIRRTEDRGWSLLLGKRKKMAGQFFRLHHTEVS